MWSDFAGVVALAVGPNSHHNGQIPISHFPRRRKEGINATETAVAAAGISTSSALHARDKKKQQSTAACTHRLLDWADFAA